MQKIISDTGEVLYEANPFIAATPPQTEHDESEESLVINEETQGDKQAISGDVSDAEPADFTDEQEPVRYAPRIMSPENNYLTVSMMRDVIRRGTGRKALALGRNDLAGKTGTTNDQKDAWFAGFSSDLVATVWIGFDQPSTLGRWASGGTTALPVWIDYMRDAVADSPERPLELPEGIVTVRIDPESGLLASPGQSDAIFEYFKAGTAPTEYARAKSILPYQDEDTNSGTGSVIPEQLF